MTDDSRRELLRHTVATLAYRGGKAVRGAPPEFAAFRAGESSRTAGEILAHVGDLLDWAFSLCRGEERWKDSSPMPWDREVDRFFAGLARLEESLSSNQPLAVSAEKLFQGPIADALTHVGQISMLRRLSGAPVKGENYFKAEISRGRVGRDQVGPRKEFD